MKHEIENIHQDVYNNIKQLMDQARNRVSREVNNILIQTYWEIGRVIVEDEQGNLERAEYGKKLITDLSKRLTKEYGKGFSKSNLFNMRNFYLTFPIFQTLSGKLSWSHYCELLSISDEKKRSFYEKETIQANWSVKELKRQIKTSLFERLILSSGDENKEKLLDYTKDINYVFELKQFENKDLFSYLETNYYIYLKEGVEDLDNMLKCYLLGATIFEEEYSDIIGIKTKKLNALKSFKTKAKKVNNLSSYNKKIMNNFLDLINYKNYH